MTSPLPDLPKTPEKCVMRLSAEEQEAPELQQAIEDYEAAPDDAEHDPNAKICDADDCPLTLGGLLDIRGDWMTEDTTNDDAERAKVRIADLTSRMPRGCLFRGAVEWQEFGS